MEEPEPWYQLWQGALTLRPFLQSFPTGWNSELLLSRKSVAWRFNFSDLAEMYQYPRATVAASVAASVAAAVAAAAGMQSDGYFLPYWRSSPCI